MRFLVNRKTKLIHDATRLVPRCRADDLAKRQNTEMYVDKALRQGFRRCRWCL